MGEGQTGLSSPGTAAGANSQSRFRLRLRLTLGLAFGIALIVLAYLSLNDPRAVLGPLQLPDGSRLEIRQVELGTSYQYSHWSTNRYLQWLAPRMPQFVRDRLSLIGGRLGMGGGSQTNLYFTTLHISNPSSSQSVDTSRIVVFDDAGNEFDAAWGGGTLSMPGFVAIARTVPIFPRRNDHLGIRILGVGQSTSAQPQWERIAEFRLRNPARGHYPHWTPEAIPAVRSNGNLIVSLDHFQSGVRASGTPFQRFPGIAPRATTLGLTFEADGQPSSDWEIQQLTIADATGNAWTPYLGFGDPTALWWTSRGRVELFGALWPGERAWKLCFELVRRHNIPASEIWQPPVLSVPERRTLINLNHQAQLNGATVKLMHLGDRDAKFPGRWEWTAKWWDESVPSVAALALQLHPAPPSRRFVPVGVYDQDGNELKVLEHRAPNDPEQVLFIRTHPDTRALRVALSVQQGRFVEFLARPTFPADPTFP